MFKIRVYDFVYLSLISPYIPMYLGAGPLSSQSCHFLIPSNFCVFLKKDLENRFLGFPYRDDIVYGQPLRIKFNGGEVISGA